MNVTKNNLHGTKNKQLLRAGEIYIKFDFEYSESNIDQITKIFKKHSLYINNELILNAKTYNIAFEFNKGSLKAKVVIWTTAIYMGIANYGSFRAGLREIMKDVKTFSEIVINKCENDPGFGQSDIIRTEKRTGIIGRIEELYSRIDKLERNINNLSDNQIQNELREIKQEIANITVVLGNQDHSAFLNELAEQYKQDLPQPDEKRVNYLLNRYALKPDEKIDFLNE